MKDRQAESLVYKQKTQALLDALQKDEYPSNPYLQLQLKTQGIMVNEYRYIAQELYRLGYKKEAKLISSLRKQVENADTRTNEQIAFDRVKNAEQNGKTVGKDAHFTIRHDNNISGRLKDNSKDKGMDI